MPELTPKALLERYRRARERRATWESHWRECYDYALPQRDGALSQAAVAGEKKTDKLFDATAADAVDQLAASLLSQLTPPWTRWFGLHAGADLTAAERAGVAAELERISATLQSHFDRSNFAVEMHQCYLDLVCAGTATLLFEEAAPGEASAFRFTAVPLGSVALEEGPSGRLDVTYRRSELTLAQVRARFPAASPPEAFVRRAETDPDARLAVIEGVVPECLPPSPGSTRGSNSGGSGHAYLAVVDDAAGGEPSVLAEGRYRQTPFISFRWLKAPGETYGRSPVMKALPDIKTANKVVELILKNASIAVTGIWQADDDGVLNPATVRLVPGTIIPKAVGSQGLTPLETPGRFDVSQLVLDDLRAGIRRALLADRLGQVDSPAMTATEVLERAAELAHLLGATYGRLQSELLTPLLGRAVVILARRGAIANVHIDGHLVDLRYTSPLARRRSQEEASSALTWLDAVRALGPEAMAAVDFGQAARWLARAFGVPGELVREPPTPAPDALGAMLAPMLAGALAASPPPSSQGSDPS